MASILPLTIQILGVGFIAEHILQLTPIDSGNTLGDEGKSYLLTWWSGAAEWHFLKTGQNQCWSALWPISLSDDLLGDDDDKLYIHVDDRDKQAAWCIFDHPHLDNQNKKA